MKKTISFLLTGLITFTLIGCTSNKQASTNVATKEDGLHEKSVDGVKFILGDVSKEIVKGDMNSDGSMNIESGEYFQFGIDKKKSADYEYVIINVKVENTTEKVVKLFQTGWKATMKDGYELKNIEVTDKLNDEQVPSNYSFEAQVKIPVEKNLNASEVELKYNLKDYSNLVKAMKESSNGKSVDNIKKDYPELYKDNFVDFGVIKIQ
ncbi:hypothetical protein KPL39_02525 [Clostridium gasigenes]|uniref:hypothetical protein n=1 Tax=Clostridium gasigenes TaxID=94869 RepID=UPI001C0C181E|nr:hypothetical protein [Clostridium gasigenes]MBU3135135.1 hypothetical protein [Clostridium gasigenes]